MQHEPLVIIKCSLLLLSGLLELAFFPKLVELSLHPNKERAVGTLGCVYNSPPKPIPCHPRNISRGSSCPFCPPKCSKSSRQISRRNYRNTWSRLIKSIKSDHWMALKTLPSSSINWLVTSTLYHPYPKV